MIQAESTVDFPVAVGNTMVATSKQGRHLLLNPE